MAQDAKFDDMLNENSGPVNPLKIVPTNTSMNVPIQVDIEENIIEANQFPILDKPMTQTRRKAKARISRSSEKRRGGKKKRRLQTVTLMICPWENSWPY